jgi:galactose mutarotase-like enzyme
MELSDYKLVFENDENSRRLLKTDLLTGETESFFETGNTVDLTHELFDRGAIIFRDLKSEAVRLERKDGKRRKATLRYPGFTHFGIWKKPHTDAPFICLEAWFGVDSAAGNSKVFTDKEGIIILKPGETFRSEYSIELE